MTTRNWRAKSRSDMCSTQCRNVSVPESSVPELTLQIDIFDTVGTYQWTAPATTTSIDYLIVAGGGGGSGAYDNGGSGGGGGGMVLTGTNAPVVP